MKQLFIDGNSTEIFFSKNASFNDVFEWIEEEVIFSESNIFNLNEKHSCDVSTHIDCILISGDEDLKTITIQEINPIK
tara:strand:+ start:509 stop:742 length:234 start_codon:yes stop_codon:yes gene_type:complete